MPSNKLKLYSYYALDAVLGLGLLYGVYKTFLARDSRGFLQSIFPEQELFALPDSEVFTPVYNIRDLIAKLELLRSAAVEYHNKVVAGENIIKPNPLIYFNNYLTVEEPEDYYTPHDITIMVKLLRELLASGQLPPGEITPGTTIEYVGVEADGVNRTIGLFTKQKLEDSTNNTTDSNQIWNEKEGIKVVKNGDRTISIGFLPSTRTLDVPVETLVFQLMKQKYPDLLENVSTLEQLRALNNRDWVGQKYNEVLNDVLYFVRETSVEGRNLPSMPSYWRKYSWIPSIYWKPLYLDAADAPANAFGYLRLKNANR